MSPGSDADGYRYRCPLDFHPEEMNASFEFAAASPYIEAAAHKAPEPGNSESR